jgi:hypothetical protein
MITAEATRYGSGVAVFGDPMDLYILVENIYVLADDDVLGTEMSDYLLGLAYDARHSLMGDREAREMDVPYLQEPHVYRGTKMLWPHILVQIALIRHSEKYADRRKLHIPTLGGLETAVFRALVEYDPKVGSEAARRTLDLPPFPPDYLSAFIESETITYLVEGRAGKQRFRRLPALIRRIRPDSSDYLAFEKACVSQADELGCHPTELADPRPWPEFRW